MGKWTRDMVEERVEEASWVLGRLPGPRRQGYFSTWPDILLSAREIASQEPRAMRVLPSPQAITRMEEAITWNQYLERDDARLMWERAAGMPWKHLCHRFGISRPTSTRRWEYALCVIAWRLNGRQLNRKRGRSFLIQRARGEHGASARPNHADAVKKNRHADTPRRDTPRPLHGRIPPG